ncbi:MAG: TIGR03619 family F420-dependent LLM class oxidoreductase [Microthrixaceae bacterium]
MAAIIPPGQTVWGFQLPIQSQSTIYVQPWEVDADTEDLAQIVRAADRAGAFYVAVCDHVGIPRPADEAMSATWYDTIATLGWIAGITESVHLLSHVYVLPYRHPLMVAKSFSTLDALSDGRAICGVGAGHLESEFAMLGVDHASRGRELEAALPVLRSAFEEGYPVVDVAGEPHEVGLAPRPVRSGGPPIWVGGSSPAAIRRAAQLADGWLPQGPPEIGTRNAIARIRELRDEAGLPSAFDMGFNCAPLHLDGTNSDEVADGLARFAERGINQLQLRFTADSAGEYCDQIDRFGAEVAPQLN